MGFQIFLLSLLLVPSQFVTALGPGSHIPGEESSTPWAASLLNFTSVDLGLSPPTEVKCPLLLAAGRTRRYDLFNRFNRYRGGWDITNEHYWSSVASTGAAAFVLSSLWFLFFGLSLGAHCCCEWDISFKNKLLDDSHRICLVLLLTFTCAAAIGSILLSVGQAKFHNEVLRTLSFVVNQSDLTVQILRNVTGYLSQAKTVNVDQVELPSDARSEIDKLDAKLDRAARTLSKKTAENFVKLKHIFSKVRSTLISIAAVMLFLALVGFLLSIFRHRHAMYIFIFSGWFLVAVTLILFGIFVILSNVVSDTCVAMDEWVNNPHAETALSDVLPCVDETTSNMTLHQSKEVTHRLVDVVNTVIHTIANSNDLSGKTTYYNQSGPLMPCLCSPYDSQLHDHQCDSKEVSLGNASSVWLSYVCTVSHSGLCVGPGRVTPDIYTQLVGAVNASYALHLYTLPLLSLQNCNFVRETFNTITTAYCPLLKSDLRLVNSGLAIISLGVMLCLLLWVVYANRPQRGEVFAELCELK